MPCQVPIDHPERFYNIHGVTYRVHVVYMYMVEVFHITRVGTYNVVLLFMRRMYTTERVLYMGCLLLKANMYRCFQERLQLLLSTNIYSIMS